MSQTKKKSSQRTYVDICKQVYSEQITEEITYEEYLAYVESQMMQIVINLAWLPEETPVDVYSLIDKPIAIKLFWGACGTKGFREALYGKINKMLGEIATQEKV